MSRHLLPALALSLLLLLGCACGPAYAANDELIRDVPLFAAGTTKLPATVGGEDLTEDVVSFDFSFLVGGNGVLVAFAEARFTEGDKRDVDIVARYIETEGPDWINKTTEKNGINWRTQRALQGKEGANHSVFRKPTAVFKGDKIYLLALNRVNGWHFELAVGAITGEVGSKKIGWNRSESLGFKLRQEVEKHGLSVSPGYDNSALLTSDGTIVFSMIAITTENKFGYMITQLKDDGEQWEVSFVENPEICHYVSLFEWKKKLITIFFGCPRDTRYVREYDEVEKEWKDAEETSFLPWSSMHDSRDFTPVTIGNKTVLLFTRKSTIQLKFEHQYRIFLFFTDGNRVFGPVGPINTQSAWPTSGQLLYTNDELFFMYQISGEPSENIVFRRLNHELETIKSVMDTWDQKDVYPSKPCNETAPEGASIGTPCVTPMPTDGLVGFWSDKGNDTQWQDGYRSGDATVKRGRKVENGHTFSRAGDGARWPLGGTTLNEQYNFTKYGFTYLATVTIHETPKNDTSLLTVGGVGVKERLGLWYKGGQWKLVSKNDKEEPAVDLETQKEYNVALILQNNTISLYVDGKSQGNPLPLSAPEEELFDIKEIYIGGYGYVSGFNMTVTNIFLYKRVLNNTELKAASKTVPPAQRTDPETRPEQAMGKAAGTVSETPRELLPQPAVLTGSQEESTTLTAATETPESTTDFSRPQGNTRADKRLQQTLRDPEDSSVCVRMGFTSLFLLGCFCLAIF